MWWRMRGFELVLKRVCVGCNSLWWCGARGSLTAAACEMLFLSLSTNAKWINHNEADLNEDCAEQGVGGVRVMWAGGGDEVVVEETNLLDEDHIVAVVVVGRVACRARGGDASTLGLRCARGRRKSATERAHGLGGGGGRGRGGG